MIQRENLLAGLVLCFQFTCFFLDRFPSMLRFRYPGKFSAGNLYSCLPFWESVLQDYQNGSNILRFLSEGVKVREFLVPFQGTVQGRLCSSDEPPSMIFPNFTLCERFKSFVSRTILVRVSNGSLFVWGEVGKVRSRI